VQFIINRV